MVSFFYRATLWVSAVFAVARCLSVHPSVCHVRVFYPDAEDVVKLLFLFRSGSPIILVFDPEHQYPILIPFSGGENTVTRGEKICDFRLKSSFISETVRDRPMVAVKR